MAGTPILVAPNQFHSTAAGGNYYVTPGSPPYIDPYRGIVYLDNYLFFVATQNTNGSGPYNVIYNTSYIGDPYGPWDQTSFIAAQIYSNEIDWIDKHHNFLVAFCDRSIEFFYDAGNGLGSPLSRQPIYAKQIGIESFGPQKTVAKDKDDIYFIGKSNNNFYDVYLLRNFQVKSVGSHYVRNVLNYYGSNSQNTLAGLEVIMLDTHPMIMITFTGSSQALVYFPESDVWWSMTTSDLTSFGNIRSDIVLASQQVYNSQRPYYVASTGNSIVNFCSTDLEELVTPPTASYYTEVVDFDSNFWKHISKVHAVGDYGNRTLTLNYCNDPTYSSYTTTSTKSPVSEGYQNAVWWSNVTRFRRGSFRIDMSGIGPCHHKAFDIEYNMGVA